MATLVNCVECGKQISSEARICPHCGNKNPNPPSEPSEPCVFCGRPVKLSEGFHRQFHGRYSFRLYKFHIHADCLKNWISIHRDLQEFSCPACHKTIAYKDDRRQCPYCGHPFSISSCDYCGQPALRDNMVERGVLDSDDYTTHYYYHKSCYEAHPDVKEEKQDQLAREQREREAKNSSSCFIATAIYGVSSPNVSLLKKFRDNVLLSSGLGTKIVNFYYKTSPPIATFLSNHLYIKTSVKYLFIEPLVRLIRLRSNLKNNK